MDWSRRNNDCRRSTKRLQEEAQDGGPPVALLTALKWLAFLRDCHGGSWLLYKLFRPGVSWPGRER